LQGALEDFQRDYVTLGKHIHDANRKYDEADRKLERFSDKLQQVSEITAELPEATKEEAQKELSL
jgi:hypothetical protein